MLADRVICRRHDQFFQLFEVNPSEVMAPKGFENAFIPAATIGQEKNGIIWVGMVDSLKDHPYFYLDIQFLFQLSSQSLSRLFPLFHLPPWKFPEKALVGILFSLGDEDFPRYDSVGTTIVPIRSDSYRLIPLLGFFKPIIPSLELLFLSLSIPFDHKGGCFLRKDLMDSQD